MRAQTSFSANHFWARITGLSHEVLAQCSAAFQIQMRNLGLYMLFTATIGGCLLAAGLGSVFQTFGAALSAFVLSAGLTLLLDRSIISSLRPPSVEQQLIRTLPILAWIVFHTTIFDIFLFERDIKSEFQRHQLVSSDTIRQKYASDILKLNSKQDSLDSYMKALLMMERGDNTLVLNEIDGKASDSVAGYGPKAIAKEKFIKANAAEIKAEKERTTRQQTDIVRKIAALEKQREEEIKALPTFDSSGPLDRAKILNAMLWGRGNTLLKIFTLATMIIIFMLEMLPLWAKNQSNFVEYIHCHELMEQVSRAKNETQYNYEKEIAVATLTNKGKQTLMQIQAQAELALIQENLQLILQRFKQEVQTIYALSQEENAANTKVPGTVFQHLIQRAADRAREEITELLQQHPFSFHPN